MNSIDPGTVVMAAGGAGLLGITWLGLSGRYRGWVSDGERGHALMLAVLPGLGLIFLLAGLGFVLNDLGIVNDDGRMAGTAAVTGSVLLVVAMVITWLKPPWWGPRWYREQLGIGRQEPPVTQIDSKRDIGYRPLGLDPKSPLGLAENGSQPLDRWQATFIVDFDRGTGPDGELLLYREGLAFVGSKPFAQTPFVEKFPPPPGEIDNDVPYLASASARQIAEVQLRTEFQWRDDVGDPIRTFRPATPFIWIRMQAEDQVLPLMVAHPKQVAQRISEVFSCPLEQVR